MKNWLKKFDAAIKHFGRHFGSLPASGDPTLYTSNYFPSENLSIYAMTKLVSIFGYFQTPVTPISIHRVSSPATAYRYIKKISPQIKVASGLQDCGPRVLDKWKDLWMPTHRAYFFTCFILGDITVTYNFPSILTTCLTIWQ